ncbi:YiiX/YebB-like N1pC/P60 family cysteine hydrolase [Planctomycetota bacterium]
MSAIDGFRPIQHVAPDDELPQASDTAAAAEGGTPPPAASGQLPGAVGGRMAILAGLAGGAKPVDPQQVDKDVDTLFKAMKGAGSDEDAIFKVLENRTPEERQAIEDRFAAKHGETWRSLSYALHDELSGSELQRAQDALLKDRSIAQRGEIMRDYGQGNPLSRGVAHFLTWYNFGIGGKSDVEDGLPRLTGDEVREKMLPHLKPGDTILCGNNGGVSHAMVYVGDGKMIHSMATQKTMRGHAGRIKDTLTAPFDIAKEKLGLAERQQGVMVENVADFFDRFERDSYVVMRSPELTPEKTEAGLEHIRGLLGKKYDWSFAPGNDSFYCTEIVGEFYRNALGDSAPRIGGTAQHYPIMHREAVVDPLDVLRSPDLKPVLHNDAVMSKHQEDLEGRI